MPAGTSKICTKCKTEKGLSFFAEEKRGLYGRRSQCRACRNARSRELHCAEKEKITHALFLKTHPLYNVWSLMKKRCQNSNAPDFYRYGGRGIKVCTKWLIYKNFENDMLPSYKKGLSLDRVNNDDGYCFENCRWATAIEQANNKRTNHKITYKNRTMGINEWARSLGIKSSTLHMRITSYKWPVEKALTFNN